MLSVLVCCHTRTFCMSPTAIEGSAFPSEDYLLLLNYTSRGKQPGKTVFCTFKSFLSLSRFLPAYTVDLLL